MRPVFESLRPRLATFQRRPPAGGCSTFPTRRDLPKTPRVPDDRARIIAEAYRGRVVTKNLRVNAVFLAAGLWNLERSRAVVTLTLRPFGWLT